MATEGASTPEWYEEFSAVTKVIIDRVVALLTKKGHQASTGPVAAIVVDGSYPDFWFDYDPKRSRKFTIDASGSAAKGREGKFAYKEMTIDVNYEQLVAALLKQVEEKKVEIQEAEARAALRKEIAALNAEFHLDGDDTPIFLYLDTDGEIELVMPTFKTTARARQFLEALQAGGLLNP